jgi:hypothetical protein
VRSLWFGLVVTVGLSWPAAAETHTSPEVSPRCDSAADALSISDGRDVPYIAYFTPPYRSIGPTDIAWSMMATRWRATGDVQLSVGVRIVHSGTEAWRITGWQIEETQVPLHLMVNAGSSEQAALQSLKPLSTCSEGICRTYEAVSFALPLAMIQQASLLRDGALEISILTQAGETPVICFPAAILADLHRNLDMQQTSSAAP